MKSCKNGMANVNRKMKTLNKEKNAKHWRWKGMKGNKTKENKNFWNWPEGCLWLDRWYTNDECIRELENTLKETS